MSRSRRPDKVEDEAIRAVAAWAHDASLRPMQQRGMWMSRILTVLTPGGLAVICEELLKRRREARGEA